MKSFNADTLTEWVIVICVCCMIGTCTVTECYKMYKQAVEVKQ